MTISQDESTRLSPIHGVLLITLAAILWEVLGSERELWFSAGSGVQKETGNCVYQVFEGDVCVGTAFFNEQQDLAGILSRLGRSDPGLSFERGKEIPCNSCTRIHADPPRISVEKIMGRYLMSAGQHIDVNHADAEDLEAVPGIGPRLAERIVQARESLGPFQSINDLRLVQGIGKKRLSQFEPYLQATLLKPRLPVSGLPVRVASP